MKKINKSRNKKEEVARLDANQAIKRSESSAKRLEEVTADLQVSENERIQLIQSVNKQRDEIDKLQE